MERRLPVVENEGYDVVLSEHIADLLGWEREDILKKIDALIREYDLDSQFDSRGNHVVYFFEDTVADYEENIPLEGSMYFAASSGSRPLAANRSPKGLQVTQPKPLPTATRSPLRSIQQV